MIGGWIVYSSIVPAERKRAGGGVTSWWCLVVDTLCFAKRVLQSASAFPTDERCGLEAVKMGNGCARAILRPARIQTSSTAEITILLPKAQIGPLLVIVRSST